MADNINNIVGQGAFDDIKKLQTELASLVASFTNTTASITEMESKLSASKSLKEWASALKMITDAESKRAREERLAQKDENSIVNKRIKDQKDYIKSLEQQLAKKEEIRKKEVLASQQAIDASKKEEEQRKKNLSDALSAINAINEAEEKANQDRIRREKERVNSISVYDKITAPNSSANLANQFDTNIANQAKEAKDFSNQLKQSILEEIELEKKRRNELAKTAKDRRTERAINLAGIKEQKDLQKEVDKADKDTLGGYKEGASVSIYQNARKELANLRDVANSLRLQFERAAKSGKVTDDVLKNMAINADNAEKAWKELNGQLDSVEGRTGGSTRGYNQMLTETNQLLRELPNFAISARTGILSISNNLPMFIEAWQRTANAIDDTTNQARGFRGALSELGKALLSWQTIAIVAISLLIQYSDEVVDFITSTSNAEKAQRAFDKSVSESYKSISSKVSILQNLQKSLGDTNVSLEAQSVMLKEAQSSLGGYAQTMQVGIKLTSDQNKLIEQQILLLKAKAKEQAVLKLLEEGSSEMLELELALAKETREEYNILQGVWTRLTNDFAVGYEATWQKGQKVLDGVIKLTDSNKKLFDENYKLLQQDKISQTTYLRKLEVILSMEEAQTKANETFDAFNKFLGESANLGIDMSNSMSSVEISLLKAETNQKKFVKGSKEWALAGNDIKKFRQEIDLMALQQEFYARGYKTQQELFTSEEYRAKRDAILAEDVSALDNTAKSREKILWDWQKAEKQALDAMAKTRFEIAKADLSKDANVYEEIYKNEANTLQQRLDALEKYNEKKKQIANAELERELAEIENGEKLKASIEEKLGREITETSQLQSLVETKAITSAQKDILASSLNYANERVRIQKEMQKNLSDIDKESSNSTEDIIMSDLQNKMNEYSVGLKASSDKVLAETNNSILALNKAREEGLISERQYWNRLEQTLKDESDKVLIANLEFVEEFTETLRLKIDSPAFQAMSKEEQKNLTDFYNSLSQASADARRKIKNNNKDLSLFEIITGSSFRDGFNKIFPDNIKQLTEKEANEIASSFESAFQSMFQSLNEMWENYYERRYQELDNYEKEQDLYYKNEENRVNSSLMTAEEKEDALKDLNGQRLADEQELDRRRRQLARKQAEDEKKQAIFSASLSFAQGVMKIWANWAWLPIVAGALTVAAGIVYGTQLAAINSRVIPAYEKGTPKEGHKGGVALVGEKRRELVVTPDGQLFYTPSTPTLMDLPKGTHVIPNPDGMSNLAKNEALARLGGSETAESVSSTDILGYKLDNLSNIIRNKQENHIFLQNGELKKFVRKANTRINWVNK